MKGINADYDTQQSVMEMQNAEMMNAAGPFHPPSMHGECISRSLFPAFLVCMLHAISSWELVMPSVRIVLVPTSPDVCRWYPFRLAASHCRRGSNISAAPPGRPRARAARGILRPLPAARPAPSPASTEAAAPAPTAATTLQAARNFRKTVAHRLCVCIYGRRIAKHIRLHADRATADKERIRR